MPPQPHRPVKRVESPGTAGAGGAAAGAQQPVNLLDELRRREAPARRTGDIIPIPAMIAVFVGVWFFVWFLMAEGWTDEWNTYRARAYQIRGNHAAAIAPMSHMVEKYPTNPTFQAELANNYLHTENYPKAIEHFLIAQKLVEQSPAQDEDGRPLPRPDFNNQIGRAYLKLGDLPNAEKHLQAALKHNRLDKLTNFFMGELEIKRKNYREAMKYLKVIANDPAYRDQVREHYEQIEKELFASVK